MFKLLKHQQETINYLEFRCSNQKGLLLYQGMGTGKTISGLGWLNYKMSKNHHEKYLIVCPEFITISWINDSKKIGFNLDPKRMISYQKFKNQLISGKLNIKNCHIIFDEAHHLTKILKDSNFMLYLKFFEKISKSGKILLLTGTPMYESRLDISILLNICSEINKFPIDDIEFIKMYKDEIEVNKKKKNFMFNFVKPFLVYKVIPMIHALVPLYFLNETTTGEKIQTKNRAIFKSVFNMNFSETMGYIRKVCKIIGKNFGTIIGYGILSTIISLIAIKLLKYFRVTGDLKTALYQVPIDYNRLAFDSSRYINYHWNHNNENNKDFAEKMETKIIKSRFDLFQCKLCAKFFYGNLDSSLISFFLNEDEHQVFTKTELFRSYDYFIRYSRCLSNLSPWIEKIIKKESSFSVDKKNGSVTVDNISNQYILDNCCSKFKKLGELIQENINHQERVFIYSDFDIQGGYLISCYLNSLELPHVYLNSQLNLKEKSKALDTFNNKESKYNIIILDFNCSEGINLIGVEHVYLLEPTNNNSLQQQIIYRAVRYLSHSHLSKEHQKVYSYMCVSEIITRNEQHLFGISKEYFETKKNSIIANIEEVDNHYKGIIPRTGVSPIDIIMNKVWCINEPLLNAVTSPDTLCLEEIKDSKKNIQQFDDFLKKNNINNSSFKIPGSCLKNNKSTHKKKKKLHLSIKKK